MIKLFTEEEFALAKSKDKLPLQCYCCNCKFMKLKVYITNSIKNSLKDKNINACKYCSNKCIGKDKIKSQHVRCTNCNKEFIKKLNQYKKTINHFCSHSCSAKYNNQHRKSGTRRSKLEKWLENQLSISYPNVQFEFNDKKAITRELDIYIPSLKLAFELNGIFHYEPIYGKEKLEQTQQNDSRKFQLCLEKQIELCIIDVTSQRYFKESKSIIFLDIIKKIIDDKLKCQII
jgi:hypothetical protein